MPCQQAGKPIHRKTGFFDIVYLRVYSVVEGGDEVGRGKIGAVEYCTPEVCLFKDGTGKISERKGSFLCGAISEFCFLHLPTREGCIVEYATFKTYMKQKFAAFAEVDTKYLAAFEYGIIQRAGLQLHHGEVAGIEGAIMKGVERKIAVHKVATLERTPLELPALYYLVGIHYFLERLILVQCLFHSVLNRQYHFKGSACTWF